MPNTTTSQYMGMPVPVPTTDPGPQYAVDLNTCITTIDQHNHTSGNGQQIPSNGLNINLDLPFNNLNAITLRSARFTSQGGPLSLGSDIGCLYVASSDLYYNDTSGNQVRITASGGVAGTPGSIGNLVSPASVTYVSGTQTYVFQASTATPANIDVASVVIRRNVAGSTGITLSAPAALSTNYTLTFPTALPASTKILTVDNTGNIGAGYSLDGTTIQVSSNVIGVPNGGIGQVQLAPLPSSGSDTCGVFNTTSTSFVDIPSLNVSFNCSGRTLVASLIDDGIVGSSGGYISFGGSASILSGYIRFVKDGTPISTLQVGSSISPGSIKYPATSFNCYDINPVAGVHLYKVQLYSNSTFTTASAVNCKLLIHEL